MSDDRENAAPSKQSRKKGPSDDQKKYLVDFLEHNLWVARNQFHSEDGTGDLKSKWEEITKMLNMRGGAHKNPAEWKKCWADLKSSVRKRYFSLKTRMLQSGINGSIVDELDELDQRIVGIITIEALEGDGSREHGQSATVSRSAPRNLLLIDISDVEPLPGPSNTVETAASLTPCTSSPQLLPAGSAQLRQPTAASLTPCTSSPQLLPAGSAQLRQPNGPPANPKKPNKENEEMLLFKEMMKLKKRKLEILEADNLRKVEEHELKREVHTVKLELMRAKVEVLKKQL